MKFGYAIIYVENVKTALEFYDQAFGFKTRFIHESDPSEQYGELDTGDTVLAFASFPVADSILPSGYSKLSELSKPAGFEIAIVTSDVSKTLSSAIAAGAELIKEPQQKPWGQTISYVRAPDGVLVEICTPVEK